MAKFEVHVSIGLVGCVRKSEFEIPDEDLEGLTGIERDNVIEEYAKDEFWNLVDWGWEEKE